MADYALYLDDIRHPPLTGEAWVLCRTVAAMRELLQQRGIPTLASFDYELGRTDPNNNGYDAVSDFLEFLISSVTEGEGVEVEVRLHTSSSYGAMRMDALLKERYADCLSVGIHLRRGHL